MLNCNGVSDDAHGVRAMTNMLDSNEIRTNERDVIYLPKHADDTGMVDARNQDGKKVS